MARRAHPLLGLCLSLALLPAGMALALLMAPSASWAAVGIPMIVFPLVVFHVIDDPRPRALATHPAWLVGGVWAWLASGAAIALLAVAPPVVAAAPIALVTLALLFPTRCGFHRWGRWGTWPLVLSGPPLDPADLALGLLDKLVEDRPDLWNEVGTPPLYSTHGDDDGCPWNVWFRVDRTGCVSEFQWFIGSLPHTVDRDTQRFLHAQGPLRLDTRGQDLFMDGFRCSLLDKDGAPAPQSAHQRLEMRARMRAARGRLRRQGVPLRGTIGAPQPLGDSSSLGTAPSP